MGKNGSKQMNRPKDIHIRNRVKNELLSSFAIASQYF